MKFTGIKFLIVILILLFIGCTDSEKSVITLNKDKKISVEQFDHEVSTYHSLKEYIINYAKEKNRVDIGFYEKATVKNTDLLREIVHHANYKNKAEGRRPQKECYNLVGYMFQDEGVGENCGFMSTTLFDVYRAFGFKVKRYDVIDGSLKGFLKYRDSHVFVEVYIPSLKRYIIQDPTINNSVYNCKSQERLSFLEIRKDLYQDNRKPCFLDNKVSVHMSPNEKLTLRQKTGVLEDYYTGSILSVRKFDGVEERKFKLHDLGIVANEEKRVSDLNVFKKRCETCEFKKDIITQNSKIQDFMECLNSEVLAQGLLTASFNRKEKGFLIQFTNEKGQNVIYDPLHNFYMGKSYFSYAYWELNNRGFINKRDEKYMVPQKFYSYRTNEVFEF